MERKTFYNNQTFRFFSFVLILFIFLTLGKFFRFDFNSFRIFLSQFPLILSGLIFIGLYVVLTTLIWFGPKDILRIASALLFGAYVSTGFICVSELVNAIILFSLSRRLGRDFVVQKFNIKVNDVEKMKKDTSFFSSLALRSNPFIPFRLQDIAAGLSRASFKKYFWAIALASPFRIFWLQYILADVGENVMMLFSFNMNIKTFAHMESDAFLNLLRQHPFVQYLMENPFILKYSGYYFLGVLFLSALAIVVKILKSRPNTNSHECLN